jgi:hypothetical protein
MIVPSSAGLSFVAAPCAPLLIVDAIAAALVGQPKARPEGQRPMMLVAETS